MDDLDQNYLVQLLVTELSTCETAKDMAHAALTWIKNDLGAPWDGATVGDLFDAIEKE